MFKCETISDGIIGKKNFKWVSVKNLIINQNSSKIVIFCTHDENIHFKIDSVSSKILRRMNTISWNL